MSKVIYRWKRNSNLNRLIIKFDNQLQKCTYVHTARYWIKIVISVYRVALYRPNTFTINTADWRNISVERLAGFSLWPNAFWTHWLLSLRCSHRCMHRASGKEFDLKVQQVTGCIPNPITGEKSSPDHRGSSRESFGKYIDLSSALRLTFERLLDYVAMWSQLNSVLQSVLPIHRDSVASVSHGILACRRTTEAALNCSKSKSLFDAWNHWNTPRKTSAVRSNLEEKPVAVIHIVLAALRELFSCLRRMAYHWARRSWDHWIPWCTKGLVDKSLQARLSQVWFESGTEVYLRCHVNSMVRNLTVSLIRTACNRWEYSCLMSTAGISPLFKCRRTRSLDSSSSLMSLEQYIRSTMNIVPIDVSCSDVGMALQPKMLHAPGVWRLTDYRIPGTVLDRTVRLGSLVTSIQYSELRHHLSSFKSCSIRSSKYICRNSLPRRTPPYITGMWRGSVAFQRRLIVSHFGVTYECTYDSCFSKELYASDGSWGTVLRQLRKRHLRICPIWQTLATPEYSMLVKDRLRLAFGVATWI